MGAEYSARCQKCGNAFSVMQGGGFSFHLLRCDKCGKEKSVGFRELIDLHNRSLAAPNSKANAAPGRYIPENTPGPPLTEGETETLIRKHRCGGRFRFDAPPRCPKCRSTDIDLDERGPTVMYD